MGDKWVSNEVARLTQNCNLSSQVMGSLADEKCVQGQRVSGILVKKNFNYHILNPSDLSGNLLIAQDHLRCPDSNVLI